MLLPAEGATAVVYAAEDLLTGRPVALKVGAAVYACLLQGVTLTLTLQPVDNCFMCGGVGGGVGWRRVEGSVHQRANTSSV
jgi:hypothetical protein